MRPAFALTAVWIAVSAYPATSGEPPRTDLQAAVDAAPPGGTLSVPPGRYELRQGITVAKPLALSLSPGTVLEVAAATGITVRDATGVRISGGQILLRAPDSTGITFVGAVTDLTIEGVTVAGTGAVKDRQAGIANRSGPALRNLRILGNNVSRVTVGISVNADLAGSIDGVLIQGNHLSELVGTEPGSGYGIHHANGSGRPSFVRIVGNYIERAQRHAIYQAKGSAVSIIGNHVADHRAAVASGDERPAIAVGRSRDVVVQGNVIENPSDGAVGIFPAPNTVCSAVSLIGNSVRNWRSFPALTIGTLDPASQGECTNIVVQGNTFSADLAITGAAGSVAAAIRVLSVRRLLVSENSFEVLNGAVADVVTIVAAGEPGPAGAFTDDLRFQGNRAYATGKGARFVRVERPGTLTGSRLDFSGNVLRGVQAFSLAAPQGGMEVRTWDNPADGLERAASGSGEAYLQNVPTSPAATCRAGQWSADASYLYMCVASGSWRRFRAAPW